MTTGKGRKRRMDRTLTWPLVDRGAWAAAFLPPDDFDTVVGAAHHWRSRTRRNAENYYDAWLAWLRQHHEAMLTLPPAQRVTKEICKAYAKSLRERGLQPRSIATSVAYLGMAMNAISPEGNWQWLLKAGRAYGSAAAEPKFARTIPSSAVLLDAGEAVTEEARKPDPNRRKIDQAVMYRDGLMIALLAIVPMRRGDLASLKIGTTLARTGATWKIVLSPEVTKTGRPFETAWPARLLEPLRIYLEEIRPALLPPGSQETTLWISKQGGPLHPQSITALVGKRTKAGLNLRVSPHKFRHAAATTIAQADPAAVTTIAGVLGHGSIRTSEAHYNKASIGQAFARHGDIIRPKVTRRGHKRAEQPGLFDGLGE